MKEEVRNFLNEKNNNKKPILNDTHSNDRESRSVIFDQLRPSMYSVVYSPNGENHSRKDSYVFHQGTH